MKPEFILINWSNGSVWGTGTEAECREQLNKCPSGTHLHDTFIIAEVKVLSETKRVES
jgi:hypothetical protein